VRSGRPRIVIGIGDQSTGQLCERTSLALAALLDLEPVRFPAGTPVSSRIRLVSPPGSVPCKPGLRQPGRGGRAG
jgi:hypothetical protein